jgi:hypothetical protein
MRGERRGLPMSPRRALLVAATLFAPTVALADAVVVTRAMKANTIAEAFVERDAITVELEVGQADREVFTALTDASLVPPAPIPEDAPLTIVADGKRLRGTLVERSSRMRIERDEVSGEPLPTETKEEVTFVVLRYPIQSRPEGIRIEPPMNDAGYVASDIGFVLYHEGVAVNDFRYLAPDQNARLDWRDPFYSSFDRRVLNRKYQSPLNAFLYVEPFEVRKELVVRPVDVARFAGIELAPHGTIAPEDREPLLEGLAEFLARHAPVIIDGATIEPILARIHFLERGLRMTQVVPPDQPIDTTSAIVGAIFVYPVEGLPNEVVLTWDLFDERVTRVPAVATDEAGPMPSYLTPTDPKLEWKNFLKKVRIPGELEVESLESHVDVSVPAVLAGLAAMIALAFAMRRRKPAWTAVGVALLVAVWFLWPFGTVSVSLPPETRTPSPEDAAPTIHALLYNAYRALDFRDEEVVFDRLEASLSGDVLERVYLEMRRGLRLENQGGARVRVRDVTLTNLAVAETETPGALAYRAAWNVSGSVGHWGHTHIRTNAYDARLTLSEDGGRWKISDLQILEEERVQTGP